MKYFKIDLYRCDKYKLPVSDYSVCMRCEHVPNDDEVNAFLNNDMFVMGYDRAQIDKEISMEEAIAFEGINSDCDIPILVSNNN